MSMLGINMKTITVQCKTCGKVIINRFNSRDKKYCNKECWKARGEQNKVTVTINCKTCRKKITKVLTRSTYDMRRMVGDNPFSYCTFSCMLKDKDKKKRTLKRFDNIEQINLRRTLWKERYKPWDE